MASVVTPRVQHGCVHETCFKVVLNRLKQMKVFMKSLFISVFHILGGAHPELHSPGLHLLKTKRCLASSNGRRLASTCWSLDAQAMRQFSGENHQFCLSWVPHHHPHWVVPPWWFSPSRSELRPRYTAPKEAGRHGSKSKRCYLAAP